ncbi:MAG TPA: hypothetical protein VFF06_24515 [Polyangia bacterium]|nr:hypothetical protein [Polyangia bacterium]
MATRGALVAALIALLHAPWARAQIEITAARPAWLDEEIIAAFNATPEFQVLRKVPCIGYVREQLLPNRSILTAYRMSHTSGLPTSAQIHIAHGDPWLAGRLAAEMRGYYPNDRAAATQFYRTFSRGNVTWESASINTSEGATSGTSQLLSNDRGLRTVEAELAAGRGTIGKPYGWWGHVDQVVTANPNGKYYVAWNHGRPVLMEELASGRTVAREYGDTAALTATGEPMNMTRMARIGNARVPYLGRAFGLLGVLNFAVHAAKDGPEATLVGFGQGLITYAIATRVVIVASFVGARMLGSRVTYAATARFVGTRIIPVVGWIILALDTFLLAASWYYDVEITWGKIWEAITGKLDKPQVLAGPPPAADQALYLD